MSSTEGPTQGTRVSNDAAISLAFSAGWAVFYFVFRNRLFITT